MNGFSLLFGILAVLNAWRFRKTGDRWYLALGLLFASMLIRGRIPDLAHQALQISLVIWLVWLGAFKFIPSLRLRRLLANTSLRPLTDEEREWRSTLEDWEKVYVEDSESLYDRRWTKEEATGHLEFARKSREESAARQKEKEAFLKEVADEEERERAAEAERKELEVTPVATSLPAISSAGSNRAWLKLERVGGDEEEDGGMVVCKVWNGEPKPHDPGVSSYLCISEVIGFPPGKSDARPEFWSSMSEAFRRMFESRCLIADVALMDDGRERFDFQIENREFVIMTKYLSWRTDLALDQDSKTIWVRISGMLSEVWEDGTSEQGSPQRKLLDFDRIPAFLYPVPVDRLLPATNPGAHFMSPDERYE